MGGAMPIGASSLGGRWLPRITVRDENRSVSYAMAATSSWRVGSHAPPYRSVCAIGQRSRRSAMIGYGSFAQRSSVWSKSVAKSETGPSMISLSDPSGSPPRSACSMSSANRLRSVMADRP